MFFVHFSRPHHSSFAKNSSKRDESFMNALTKRNLWDSKWIFSICDNVGNCEECIYYHGKSDFSPEVINGMIYVFNFILPLEK